MQLFRIAPVRKHFYPRPPRGGRPAGRFSGTPRFQFLSTPSARRATDHAAPPSAFLIFLSTPSARRATVAGGAEMKIGEHFYPRPPRGGRLSVQPFAVPAHPFLSTPSARRATVHLMIAVNSRLLFLSTPSARRATPVPWRVRQCAGYFYPRPPRGGRRWEVPAQGIWAFISIHALREEGDISCMGVSPKCSVFLSTPSARRATQRRQRLYLGRTISIHALREEGDIKKQHCKEVTTYFYPRPPRGGRLTCDKNDFWATIFLSTPSARRATATISVSTLRWSISIHALREEGDAVGCLADLFPAEFLSTPSARRATVGL